MTTVSPGTAHRCQFHLNSYHSTVYFTPYLNKYLAEYGVSDDMAVYFAGRAAPLGAVGPGVITAIFNGFAHGLVAELFPGLWQQVAPSAVLEARLRAVDATLRQVLDERELDSPGMVRAAELALRAAEACERADRPLFAANADLPVPDEPHLAFWHAATLLREYRGGGHFSVLSEAGLAGLDGLVSHCASPQGMPREFVMTKRGWTIDDWQAAEERLRERGLMDKAGALTPKGLRLREQVEEATDRLDRAPYARLGERDASELTELARRFVASAAALFPPPVLGTFVEPD
ncbi:SCO6745 family protein [Streptomyces sp. NPDC002144]